VATSVMDGWKDMRSSQCDVMDRCRRREVSVIAREVVAGFFLWMLAGDTQTPASGPAGLTVRIFVRLAAAFSSWATKQTSRQWRACWWMRPEGARQGTVRRKGTRLKG
jgi:hypothetical protein